MLVDVHAHLEDKKFKKIDEIIKEAEKNGVGIIITAGINQETNELALKLSEKYGIVKCSFGLYPLEIKNKETGEKIIKWIGKNKDKCVGIGEIGLDYKFGNPEDKKQKDIFEKLIKLAKRINKPVIVHSRKAESDVLDILEKNKIKKVVLHCFNGKKSLIKRALSLNFYFSIPPIITKFQHFQMLCKEVPLSKILTETDSPYLSPYPDKINTPKNVKITIKKIAEIKGIDEEKVETEIFNNFKLVFNFNKNEKRGKWN